MDESFNLEWINFCNDEIKKKEVMGYIERAIPDISRKCGINQDIVLRCMLEKSNNYISSNYGEIKDLNVT